MDKNQLIFDIYVVYDKMKQYRVAQNLELWPLQDYSDLIALLQDGDWQHFGKEEYEKIDWIITRYFGRGEIVAGYCPKVISYEESFAAQNALDSIASRIQSNKSLGTEH
jgi:hypothetical protein